MSRRISIDNSKKFAGKQNQRCQKSKIWLREKIPDQNKEKWRKNVWEKKLSARAPELKLDYHNNE